MSRDRKSSDAEEETLLAPSSRSFSSKLEMTSLKRSVSENEPSRLTRIMRSVPSLNKLFRRRPLIGQTSTSRGVMSRSYSSSPTLRIGQSESRDNAVHEMVTSRKLYTSYFYRNAIMFFLARRFWCAWS